MASGMDSRRPRRSSTISRSAFPLTQTIRSPSPRRRSRTAPGCGPATMSPVRTIRSAARTSGSASTASNAGRTPWMSDSTATLCGITPQYSAAAQELGEELGVGVGLAEAVEQGLGVPAAHGVAQGPGGGQFGGGHQQFFLARARLGDVDRGEDAPVGDLAVQPQLGVAGSLVLLEKQVVA